MKKQQPHLFRQMMDLALPAMVQEALQTVVQYADAAMVGQLGAAASAAVGLTTPVGWLINAPLFAMGTGFLSCMARYLGAGRQEDARRASAQSLWAVLALGLVIGGITLSVSGALPRWLQAEEAIRADATAYFRIVCLPMLFRAAIAVFGSDLRAAGDTKTPMRISLAMNALNLLLNTLLIFAPRTWTLFGLRVPLWGAGWGVRGAAVASAAAYVLGGVLMARAWWRQPKLSPVSVGLKLHLPVLKTCARVAFPIVLTRVGMGLGYVVFMAQVSSLGTLQLAAHTLAITAEEAAYLPGYGMQAAASTLAGYAVGAGDAQRLRRLSRMLVGTAAGIMACTGALLFLFAVPVMRFFSADAAVVALGAQVLRLIAVTEPLYAVGIILEGIFHGAGDTRAPFLINMGTMWGVRILLTSITVHLLHGGLLAVWLCMALDNMVRVACLALRYRGGRWRHQLPAR